MRQVLPPMSPLLHLRRVAAVLAVFLLAVPVLPRVALASANTEMVEGWLHRLEAEAAQIDAASQQPATVVSGGMPMELGHEGSRVGQLTARLGELGFLPPEQRGLTFSSEVETAVRRFQTDQGLFVDGVVGPQTIAALNRTAEDRLRALRWTIEQMREFAADVPDTFLLINIPSTRAQLIRNGVVLLDMRAAVGRPSRPTPLLVDRIVNVTLNPVWSVPSTIMREDVLPRLRQYGATGIPDTTVYLHGERVDPGAVDWSGVNPWEIWIRQSPGPNNALGRYLFSLTNGYNVFVHDTNQRSIFGQANREISSGCVRVEGARALAEFLLTENGTDLSVIDRTLATSGTRVIPLDHPMPVFVTYWTATPRANEQAAIHRDIYRLMVNFRPQPPVASLQPQAQPHGSTPAVPQDETPPDT